MRLLSPMIFGRNWYHSSRNHEVRPPHFSLFLSPLLSRYLHSTGSKHKQSGALVWLYVQCGALKKMVQRNRAYGKTLGKPTRAKPISDPNPVSQKAKFQNELCPGRKLVFISQGRIFQSTCFYSTRIAASW